MIHSKYITTTTWPCSDLGVKLQIKLHPTFGIGLVFHFLFSINNRRKKNYVKLILFNRKISNNQIINSNYRYWIPPKETDSGYIILVEIIDLWYMMNITIHGEKRNTKDFCIRFIKYYVRCIQYIDSSINRKNK